MSTATATSKPRTEQSQESNHKPLIKIVNGQAMTTSIKVAEKFEKNHKRIMEDIRKMANEIPNDFHVPNFGLVEIIEKNAIGGKVYKSYYNLTRDGFTLLAMGFTGKKAMQFKLAYIAAFNKMEKALQDRQYRAIEAKLQAIPTVTPEQQFEIKNRVSRLACALAEANDRDEVGPYHFSRLYKELKGHFRVARYNQIPEHRFREALDYIDGMATRMLPPPEPPAPAPAPELPPEPEFDFINAKIDSRLKRQMNVHCAREGIKIKDFLEDAILKRMAKMIRQEREQAQSDRLERLERRLMKLERILT